MEYLITVNVRSPGNAFVEGDASSASYFIAGAAVTGGTVTVEGCGTSSLQVLLVPLSTVSYDFLHALLFPCLLLIVSKCLNSVFQINLQFTRKYIF